MNAVTQLAFAVVLGACLAAGLLLAAVRIPRWAAPSLERRIAPYLRDVADPRGLTALSAPAWGSGWRAVGDRVIGMWGGHDLLAARLRQAGRSETVPSFRAGQLAWGLTGLAGGAVLAVAMTLAGRGGPIAVLLPPIAAAGAVVLCEYRLTLAARRRMARIEEELPTVLEFLALCLSAGEGLRDALRRVGEIGTGELTAELRRAVLASGTGSSLSEALIDLARSVDVPALSRAMDHVVAAIDRGAPLAHVLQDGATDAREDATRRLLEAAGRKEILMLLPLVFLILPLSVLFAVFPGIILLKLGIG